MLTIFQHGLRFPIYHDHQGDHLVEYSLHSSSLTCGVMRLLQNRMMAEILLGFFMKMNEKCWMKDLKTSRVFYNWKNTCPWCIYFNCEIEQNKISLVRPLNWVPCINVNEFTMFVSIQFFEIQMWKTLVVQSTIIGDYWYWKLIKGNYWWGQFNGCWILVGTRHLRPCQIYALGLEVINLLPALQV